MAPTTTGSSDQAANPQPELVTAVRSPAKAAPEIIEPGEKAVAEGLAGPAVQHADSRWWQVITLVIPVFLGAYLTWVSKGSENRVSQKIDDQRQILITHLQLTAELYKRRFDTYDQLHLQLVNLEHKLEMGRPNASTDMAALVAWNRGTADLTAQLDTLRRTNRLHISDDVDQLMGDAWQTGVRENRDALKQQLDKLEALMRSELANQMVD
jgi:hypothetical protein